MKHKLDVSNRILGRVATEIAILLRGKNTAEYLPYVDGGNSVEVSGVENIKVTGGKEEKKLYWHYTGYPGGIKKVTYAELIEKDQGAALRKAVYGMLPKNKLRDRMIKRLVIK